VEPLRVESAQRLFVDALKGNLEIKATDLYPYYNLLARHVKTRTPSHNSAASPPTPHDPIPVAVEMPMGKRGRTWLDGNDSNVQKHLQIGTKTYECKIHYTKTQ
jgi:hypothetical protein